MSVQELADDGNYEEMENVMNFERFAEMYEELNGDPLVLDKIKQNFNMNWDANCDEIIDAITGLPGGKESYITEVVIKLDEMLCSERHVAETFKSMMKGYLFRQKSSQDIFRYNVATQLWENAKFILKTVFINCMDAYFNLLDQSKHNINRFIKGPDTKAEDTKEYYKRKKMYRNFLNKNSTIDSILKIFNSIAPVEDTLFDLNPEYDKFFSFKNGIYNLETCEFRKRTRDDRLTQALHFDYDPLFDTTAYDDISAFFKKLQPDPEQRIFTVSFLKYCLKGGNEQSKFKMNIGSTGANGKTSEMECFQKAFPIYTTKLHRSSFTKNCTKLHKYMFKLVSEPIRLAYINELDENQLDVEFIKDCCDDNATIPLDKMYGTMCENSRIQAKFITTSNKDPNLQSESALTRRMLVQNYESRFVSEELVDEKKNLYLMDTAWVKTRFSQDKFCLAFFHYLRCTGVVPLKVPKSNEQLSLETLNESDEFLSTLTTHFVITEFKDDRVSRDELQKYFPGVSLRAVHSNIKRLGIKYDKNTTMRGARGVYRGIRKLNAEEIAELQPEYIEFEDPE